MHLFIPYSQCIPLSPSSFVQHPKRLNIQIPSHSRTAENVSVSVFSTLSPQLLHREAHRFWNSQAGTHTMVRGVGESNPNSSALGKEKHPLPEYDSRLDLFIGGTICMGWAFNIPLISNIWHSSQLHGYMGGCSGVDGGPKTYVHTLIPRTCEYYLIWKKMWLS